MELVVVRLAVGKQDFGLRMAGGRDKAPVLGDRHRRAVDVVGWQIDLMSRSVIVTTRLIQAEHKWASRNQHHLFAISRPNDPLHQLDDHSISRRISDWLRWQ